LLGGILLLQPGLLPAQDFPKRSISVIVPYAPGGSVDLLARAITKVSGKHFPVPVVVVNQAGGAAIPGRTNVVNSKPDGYTLLFGYGSGEDLVTPHTQKLPYDQFKDLIPVCQMSVVSIIALVPSSHPANNLKEFVDWAKKQNRQISGAVSIRGASVDITMQALMKVAGINAQTIPFRGDSEAIIALLGGHTDFAGNTPPGAFSHVKAGRARILGVCLRERDPIIPDVPTFMEQGINVFTMGAIRGFGAPKATPDAVIDYLEKTFKKVSEDPEFHAITREMQIPVMYRDRKVFLKNMTDGFEMYGQLIDKLGLKEQK
ncbi:MAG TPA: tripartite tricarboxylate transporter substrate binding protein, partial [Thermodesulfobacteriota bacterium]|nr:tripartite tricarboxylate transporter substrate binding protein [Thermodesulfobacteriota bacterium]